MGQNKKDKNAVNEPATFEELTQNLERIVGRSISDLAKDMNQPLPISPLHGKGFTGELIEKCLGASAQNLPIPDFPKLGVELKTIPVDDDLKPLESMFLCYAPLTDIRHLSFENSSLYTKIRRMLFVLVTASRDRDYVERYVVGYFFYAPSPQELAVIRNDFNEIYELIKTGNIDKVNARLGSIIQMRPKAANGKALTECVGPEGEIIKTRPRGFYMRRSFSSRLIEQHLQKNEK